MDLLTTTQAATRLGISRQRVRQLIALGQLPAHRFGRDWLLEPQAVAQFQPRPVGYPKGRARK